MGDESSMTSTNSLSCKYINRFTSMSTTTATTATNSNNHNYDNHGKGLEWESERRGHDSVFSLLKCEIRIILHYKNYYTKTLADTESTSTANGNRKEKRKN